MKIIVNGAERETGDGLSVADIVAGLMAGVTGDVAGRAPGVAVAVNGEVVPRAEWPATILREADRVEVLTAVQGG